MAKNEVDASFLEAVKNALPDLSKDDDFVQEVWDKLDLSEHVKAALQTDEVKAKIYEQVAQYINDEDVVSDILSGEDDSTLDDAVREMLKSSPQLAAAVEAGVIKEFQEGSTISDVITSIVNDDYDTTLNDAVKEILKSSPELTSVVQAAIAKELREGTTVGDFLSNNFGSAAFEALDEYDLVADIKAALKDNSDFKTAVSRSLKNYFDYDTNPESVNGFVDTALENLDIGDYVREIVAQNPEVKAKLNDTIVAAIANSQSLADAVEQSIQSSNFTQLVEETISNDQQMKDKVKASVGRSLENGDALDVAVRTHIEQMDLSEQISDIVNHEGIGYSAQKFIKQGVENAVAVLDYNGPVVQNAVEMALFSKLIAHPEFVKRAEGLIEQYLSEEGNVEDLFRRLTGVIAGRTTPEPAPDDAPAPVSGLSSDRKTGIGLSHGFRKKRV